MHIHWLKIMRQQLNKRANSTMVEYDVLNCSITRLGLHTYSAD